MEALPLALRRAPASSSFRPLRDGEDWLDAEIPSRPKRARVARAPPAARSDEDAAGAPGALLDAPTEAERARRVHGLTSVGMSR